MFVVAGGGGDSGVGEVEHVDAVLVAVAGVSDVDAGRVEAHDAASGGAVEEGEVAEGAVGEGGGEIVLGGDGGGLDHHRAGAGPVSEQDFLDAADQFAVDEGVAHVHGDGLETAGVAVKAEGARVALLEDLGRGLVGVGDSGGGGVGWCVVYAGHREVDGRNLADRRVQRKRTATPSQLMQYAVDVVVDGGGTEGGADGEVVDLGADAVGAGVVGGDAAAEGAERGDFGGADVGGDEGNGAGAGTAGDAEDLAVVEVVGAASTGGQGDAVEGACSGGAGDRRGDCGGGEAAGLQRGVVARGGAGGTGTGQLDAEGALDAGVGQQLLTRTHVGANEVAAHHVGLQRRHFEVANQYRVSSTSRSRIDAVSYLGFYEDKALACKKWHGSLRLRGWEAKSARRACGYLFRGPERRNRPARCKCQR